MYVPFARQLVDACHLMAHFSRLRVSRGEAAQALEPAALARLLTSELDALARRGGHQTLILHPFLMATEAWFGGARQVLGRIQQLAWAGQTSAVSGGNFADWLARADAE